jgi:membrane associated rhomboid family serine protease
MTLADLGTLVVLGAWLEIRSRRLVGAALAASALAVGVGVHLLAAGTSVYRGSSGLACGLFTALALDLALLAPTPRHRALLVTVLALFAAKVAWEAATGQALFAGSLGPGVEVLPVAHLLGAAGGAAAWWGVARGSRRGARS